MKNTVRRNGTKLIAIVMVMVTLFVAFNVTAFATENGTIAKVAEFKKEAIAEKAIAVKNSRVATTVEPVVEGATGAAEEAVAVVTVQYDAVDVEIESTEEILAKLNVAEEIAEVASEEKAETVEVVETVAEEIESNEIVEEEATADATLATTANAPATNNEVITMDAATAAGSVDNVNAEFATAETSANVVTSVQAEYLGTPGGKSEKFTVIGDSTLMRDGGQGVINSGNIACYPSCDMTKGVKWFAGHHTGIMDHMAGSTNNTVDNLKVGKIVRLSNNYGYQDYKVVEIQKTVGGSFNDVSFKAAGGASLWTLLTRGTQNAVVVQFCVKDAATGITYLTFHYAVAI